MGARRVARKCAGSSCLVDRDLGDWIRRRLRLPCALSWLRCVQRRSRLDRARRARTDQATNRKLEAPLRERVRGKTVESIATDPEALRAGGMLFVENCAACHGRNGRGNVALGAPDLTDGDWLYGGDGKSILTSILDGRRGAMPAFAGTLSSDAILDVAHYVASLSGKPSDSLRASLANSSSPTARRVTEPMARAIRRWARLIWLTGSGSTAAAHREPSPRRFVAAATA